MFGGKVHPPYLRLFIRFRGYHLYKLLLLKFGANVDQKKKKKKILALIVTHEMPYTHFNLKTQKSGSIENI